VVVINDSTGDDTLQTMTDDATWYEVATPKGHEWRIIEDTDPQVKQYDQQIKTRGAIPCVVIMDAVGSATQAQYTWLNKDKADLGLPVDKAGLARLLDKYTTKASAPASRQRAPQMNRALTLAP
jgi:hypothetical protein